MAGKGVNGLKPRVAAEYVKWRSPRIPPKK